MQSGQATHPVLSGGNFALISAQKPGHRPEIDGGHQGLERVLSQQGLRYEPTHGHKESLFIVHGVPRDVAMELGRKAGQESVVFSNGGKHELIYTNGPNAGKYHPATGHLFYPAAPTDGESYVKVPGVGFVRFQFDLNKLLDVPQKGAGMEATKQEEMSKAEGGKPPVYLGWFLSPEAREALLKRFPPKHPNVFADHATFQFGPKPEHVQQFAPHLGTVSNAKVSGYAEDDKGQAVTLDIPNPITGSTQKMHVTISTAHDPVKNKPVPPVYSGQLISDPSKVKTLDEPFTLEGVHDHFPRTTKKSEMTVSDFKQALAKSLQNQINKFSKKLEDLAMREVNDSDEEPTVADFKLIKSDFSIELPEGVCPTCFQKDEPGSCDCLSKKEKVLSKSLFGLTMAAAMKRVYDSYLQNVARHQHPNDPQKAHELALAAAKDWAHNIKDPQAASQMALGHGPEDYAATAHAQPIPDPDSMGPVVKSDEKPEMCKTCKSEVCKCMTKRDPYDPPSHPDELHEEGGKGCKECGAKPAKHFGYCRSCHSKLKADYDRDADKDADFDKGEKKATKTPAKKITREVNPTGENRRKDFATRRRIDSERDEQKRNELAARGYDVAIKNLDWKDELTKSDDWMEKSSPPGFSEETMHKLKSKYGVESAEKIAWAAYKKKNHGSKAEKKEVPLSKPPVSEAQRRAMHAAASGHSTLGIPKSVGEDFSEADKGGKLPEKKAAKKSETFIDDKSAATPPKTTDEAKKGGPRVKDVGLQNTDPAPATKPVPGKLDEGSGGAVTKGKGLKKEGMPMTDAGAASGYGNTLSASELGKVTPPMAKPPSGKMPTPAAPPQSKPVAAKAPTMKPVGTKLPKPPKAGVPNKKQEMAVTRPGAPEHYEGSSKVSGEAKPDAGSLEIDQKALAHAHGRGPRGQEKFFGFKRSEGGGSDFQKSLGGCVFCGKPEHAGICEK